MVLSSAMNDSVVLRIEVQMNMKTGVMNINVETCKECIVICT